MSTKVTIHDSSNPVIGAAMGGTQVFIHDQGGDPSRRCNVTVHDDKEDHKEIAPGVRLGDLSGAPRPATKVTVHDQPPPTKVIIHEPVAAAAVLPVRPVIDDEAALRVHEGVHDRDG